MLNRWFVFCAKPDAGTPFSLEGQASLNTSTLSFSSPTIRARYFFADNMAARLSLGINNTSSTDNYYELVNNGGGQGTEINNTSSTNIALGFEYHFEGTDKLSPYGGLELGFGMGNTTASWDKFDGFGYDATTTAEIKAPTSNFGFNLVAGTDYYFAENFYLGLELGLCWRSSTVKAGESVVTLGNVTTTTLTAPSASSYFGNNFITTFRLGWRF